MDKKISEQLSEVIDLTGQVARRLTERRRPGLAEQIRTEAEHVQELTASGAHASSFAKELAARNSAYASFSTASERGKDYERECREAGERMQQRFLPCRDSRAPLPQHGRR